MAVLSDFSEPPEGVERNHWIHFLRDPNEPHLLWAAYRHRRGTCWILQVVQDGDEPYLMMTHPLDRNELDPFELACAVAEMDLVCTRFGWEIPP